MVRKCQVRAVGRLLAHCSRTARAHLKAHPVQLQRQAGNSSTGGISVAVGFSHLSLLQRVEVRALRLRRSIPIFTRSLKRVDSR